MLGEVDRTIAGALRLMDTMDERGMTVMSIQEAYEILGEGSIAADLLSAMIRASFAAFVAHDEGSVGLQITRAGRGRLEHIRHMERGARDAFSL